MSMASAFEHGRGNSKDAFRRIKDYQRRVVFPAIRDALHVKPMTCEEIEEYTGLPHTTTSAALTHMNEERLVERTLRKRKNRSGARADEWQIAGSAPVVAQTTIGLFPGETKIFHARSGGKRRRRDHPYRGTTRASQA